MMRVKINNFNFILSQMIIIMNMEVQFLLNDEAFFGKIEQRIIKVPRQRGLGEECTTFFRAFFRKGARSNPAANPKRGSPNSRGA